MYKIRSSSAASITELIIGLFVLIPIVLLFFDFGVIAMAVQINDSTCREAARQAAYGQPTNIGDLEARANAVISRANSSSAGILSKFRLISPIATLPSQSDLQKQLDALRGYGGPVTGTVTVQCEVDVRPFVVRYAYDGGKPLIFRAQHSFPFTYVVPVTAAPSAVSN